MPILEKRDMTDLVEPELIKKAAENLGNGLLFIQQDIEKGSDAADDMVATLKSICGIKEEYEKIGQEQE